ncbi:MAG: AAA family ATPase [Rikenellaceae bacterium]
MEIKKPNTTTSVEASLQKHLDYDLHKDTNFSGECQAFEKENLRLFDSHVLITDSFKDPEPLLNICNQLALSRGNIVGVIGKPKSFKTFLTSAIAATIEDSCLNMTAGDSVAKIMIIDSEQSSSHVHKVLQRIYKMCAWDMTKNDDRVITLSLREYPTAERLEITLKAIEQIHPDIVIIDGIRDLVVDFNSIDESSKVIGRLMAYSTNFNCGIICILHQNKADNNARGHLGTELMNKSETVIHIVNDKGIASVEPLYCRNREFEGFSFRINFNGLPELCEPPKVAAKTEELEKIITKAMWGSSWIERKELVGKLATLSGKTERTAQRKITDAITANLLRLNEVGKLVLTTPQEREQVMPF